MCDCFSFSEKWGWVGKWWHHKETRRGSVLDFDALPVTKRKMTLCCATLSHVLPDSLQAEWCVYLKCLYGYKIHCCVLKCVQCVLSSVTKQRLSATPGQHTIIFTLTRQQMQDLSIAPSLSTQSVRQAAELSQHATGLQGLLQLYMSPFSHHLLIPFLWQWVWHVVRGGWIEWENQLTGTPLFCSQTHTPLTEMRRAAFRQVESFDT